MKHRPGGNGSSKFPVHHEDMGGWVRIYTDKAGPLPADFAVYLSASLADWFRQRPQLRMREVVPIQRDGNTVELHCWFDVVILPPTPSSPSPAQPGSPPD